MKIPRLLLVPVLGAGLLFLCATVAVGAERKPEVHGTFDGDPMYTVLPADAIPAIREPKIVSAAEAADQMAADEPVIGVVIGGQARAYSTWQLDAHEIVNDELGGAAIAATW